MQQKNAQKEIKLPLHIKLMTGAMAGMVGTCCIYPIDMVKTRLQSGSGQYNGMIHCFKTMKQKEGIKGFYKGLGPNLIGVTPEKAIKLAVNDFAREYFEKNQTEKIKLHQEILSGAFAGLCQVVATTPMELIKIRMQLQALLPKEQQQSTIQVVQSLGITGMYKGLAATLSRDVPFSCLFFPLYSNLKYFTQDSNGHNSINSLLISGMLSGAIAGYIATPLDVVKTRLQQKGGEKYGGMANCYVRIYQDEGFATFFKGGINRAIVVGPLFAIALLAFEKQKQYLSNKTQ